MRVAHVGNVANIAYLNVKFLRRLGVDAHLYYYDHDLCLAQPEWEEAIIEGECDVLDREWRAKVRIRDFSRPEWAHAIDMAVRRGRLRISLPMADRRRGGLRGALGRLEDLANRALPVWQQHRIVSRALRRRGVHLRLSPLQTMIHFDIYRFAEIARRADLVQAYGTEPIACLADFPPRPFIAYEFGTMRDIPFEGTIRGKLLSAAYRQAERVIITNPDVQRAAERLRLRNWVFVPHPIDEDRFAPGPSVLRAKLEDKYGSDLHILFAPARHDWAVKGNDRMLRAVSRVLPAVGEPTVLVLTRWGADVQRSESLVRSLGIQDWVVWTPPLCKRTMLDHYRAADVVLDQFVIGTFGLTAGEAMACAKPVMLKFDAGCHEGLFPEMPPVIPARDEEEIAVELRRLMLDQELREAIGKRAREWVCQHHGWRTVADRQIQLYEDILGPRASRAEESQSLSGSSPPVRIGRRDK